MDSGKSATRQRHHKGCGSITRFQDGHYRSQAGAESPYFTFVNVWKNAVLLRANWLRLTLALGEGGKLRWLVTGFSAVARARTLGGVLSGGLVRGIMIAGRAVLWIGRALLMNPIGLAITAVAAAAYLIYRNWGLSAAGLNSAGLTLKRRLTAVSWGLVSC
jgi:hypothetical protein